jgi:hypothetical protein
MDADDTINARRANRRVALEPSSRMEVYLDPADARTFARGILALADEIDGGEAKKEPAVGARVRVTHDDMTSNIGKCGTLLNVDKGGENQYTYRVLFDGMSAALGGVWVLDVEPTDTPSDPRAELITRADEVLEERGLDYTATDVIALARFLAGE